MYLVLTALWFHLLMCCTVALRLYIVTAYTEESNRFVQMAAASCALAKAKRSLLLLQKCLGGCVNRFCCRFPSFTAHFGAFAFGKGNLFSILKYLVCTLLSLV